MRTFSLPDQTGQAGKFLQTDGQNVLWATGGGGGGSISGTIAANQVAFGSGVNTIAGSNNLTWLNATGVFTVGLGGDRYFLVDVPSQLYALGDLDGGGNGNRINVDDSNQSVDVLTSKQFNVFDTSGNQWLAIDASAHTVSFGDLDGTFNGRKFIFDDGSVASPFSFVGGDLNINSNFIHNVLDPLNAQDVATKNYVDSFVVGLSWKTLVRVATVVAGTLATSFENGDTVDGVVLATGNRILIKNQVAQTENGIYTVNASGAPTRATDADTGAELVSAAVAVSNGTVNANTAWVQNTPGPITIGVTNIVFVQFLNTVYTAGTGLSLTGNVFSLDVAHANLWTGAQTFASSKFELAGASSGKAVLSAAATTSSYNLFLPASMGAVDTVMVNDGAGQLNNTGVAVYKVQVSLSSAQILALNFASRTLVAAPGAGKIIVPISTVIKFTFGTVQYSGGVMRVSTHTGGSPSSTTTWATSSTYTGAVSAVSNFVPFNIAITDIPLNTQLSLGVSGTNPTLGDGTAVVTVEYMIVTP